MRRSLSCLRPMLMRNQVLEASVSRSPAQQLERVHRLKSWRPNKAPTKYMCSDHAQSLCEE